MNIAIYTNILTPYRKYFYDFLNAECKKRGDNFHVILMAETEPDRKWHYRDLKSEYTILLKSKTLTVAGAYIHINRGLKTVLKKLQLDLLICAGGYLCPGIWQALRLRKAFHYQAYFWSESHLNEVKQHRSAVGRLREMIRKSVYRKFDGFWYAGKLSKEFIRCYSSADADLLFVPNLVEEAVFESAYSVSESVKESIKTQMGLSAEKIIMLCPARLTAVKGIDRFLEIFSNTREKDSFCILLAGDGEQKERIAEIAGGNHLDVRILGYCSQKEMVKLYSISDVLLLPSLSDPNPLTCIEALWAGLFLLISDHCGNYPEVVESPENGFVFSYADHSGIDAILSQLAHHDTAWYEKAGNASHTIAASHYRTAETVNRILTHHAERLQEKGALD